MEAYRARDIPGLQQVVENLLTPLMQEVAQLHSIHRELWYGQGSGYV